MTRKYQHKEETLAKRQELKERYVKYYEDVPVQKFAAMSIGKTEPTIILWKEQDEKFLNAILEAESRWVQKNVLKTKAEFRLERMRKQIFGANVDITTDGKPLPTPILKGIIEEDKEK